MCLVECHEGFIVVCPRTSVSRCHDPFINGFSRRGIEAVDVTTHHALIGRAPSSGWVRTCTFIDAERFAVGVGLLITAVVQQVLPGHDSAIDAYVHGPSLLGLEVGNLVFHLGTDCSHGLVGVLVPEFGQSMTDGFMRKHFAELFAFQSFHHRAVGNGKIAHLAMKCP